MYSASRQLKYEGSKRSLIRSSRCGLRHTKEPSTLQQAGTASDIFVFAEDWVGKEHSTPANIIAQELCNNIRRCLVHDDVAKSITMQELHRAKDEWMCSTLDELYDEMELRDWNTVQRNRCARAAKACNQVKVRPMWPVEEQEEDTKKLSWAAATRSLRRLKARIVSVRGKREYP